MFWPHTRCWGLKMLNCVLVCFFLSRAALSRTGGAWGGQDACVLVSFSSHLLRCLALPHRGGFGGEQDACILVSFFPPFCVPSLFCFLFTFACFLFLFFCFLFYVLRLHAMVSQKNNRKRPFAAHSACVLHPCRHAQPQRRTVVVATGTENKNKPT